MKRTIQCPKCESKLAVFDTGKPIKQRCPRCGNAFEVASEEKKEAAASKLAEKKSKKITAPVTVSPEATEAAPVPVAAPEATPALAADAAVPTTEPKADAAAPTTEPKAETAAAEKAADAAAPDPAPAPDASATASAPAAAPDKKEITLKKPVGRPASSASRPATPAPADAASVEPMPAHGVSFLHIVVLFGLIILVIIAMVVNTKKTQNRMTKIEDAIRQLQSMKK